LNKNNNPPVTQKMDRTLFFKEANQISDNPLTRVSRYTATKIGEVLNGTNNKDYFIDVHMHAFNKSNIPSGFAMTTLGLPQGIVNLIASIFTKKTHQLVNSRPEDILSDLLSQYNATLSNHTSRPEIFLTLLMMDMQQGIKGTIEADIQDQLRSVLKLKKEYEYKFPLHNDSFTGKNHLLPFLALDPNNPDAYSLFLSAFSKKINTTGEPELDGTSPFVGIKIYPSLGYLPNHPTLMDIFEICEKKNIPVTTHAGGSRTHTSFDKMVLPRREYNTSNGTWTDKWFPAETNLSDPNIDLYKQVLLYPQIWEKVLYPYPNLKLNIAHMGSGDEWETVNNKNKWGSLKQTIDLVSKYNNVYADFSYSFHKKENLKWLFNKMNNTPILHSKIMYGSDFFLNEVEKGSTQDHLMRVLELINHGYKDKVFYKNAITFMFHKYNNK
jgi:predicted TIM-barrel fold metal-dependent hydrolase